MWHTSGTRDEIAEFVFSLRFKSIMERFQVTYLPLRYAYFGKIVHTGEANDIAWHLLTKKTLS